MSSGAGGFAAFGGAPLLPRTRPAGNQPDWPRTEKAIRGIFSRHYFANNGPLVRSLDRALAEEMQVAHAVCVTNETVAMTVLATALEVRGEVVMPGLAFPALAEGMQWAGLAPVFCDVDPATHTITAGLAAPRVGSRTAAIAGAHLWSRPCDPEALQVLAAQCKLPLVFDATQAAGSMIRGDCIGSFGKGQAFSLHASGVLNGGEGGFVTTNDDRLADRLRTIRNFRPSETFAPSSLRTNGKMSEMQAALALLSLEDLPRNIAANRERYAAYAENIEGIRGISLLPCAEGSNFQYIVLDVDARTAGIGRDVLGKVLRAENVLGPGTTVPRAASGDFPVAQSISSRLLPLPNGSLFGKDEIAGICELVRRAAIHAEEVTARIGPNP
jgi:dTDP-4-amino-4,6-dideoxyglucose